MYFSLRMWLVFVLHAFCVSAFTVMYELLEGASGLLVGYVPVGGFLGLSLCLGAMCLGYLAIQV